MDNMQSLNQYGSIIYDHVPKTTTSLQWSHFRQHKVIHGTMMTVLKEFSRIFLIIFTGRNFVTH